MKTNTLQGLASILPSRPYRLATAALAVVALAATEARAATVFTGISTYFTPANGPSNGLVYTGGPDLPTYVPVGQSFLSFITFTDSAGGPPPQSISWQLQRPLTDSGPVPVASDFRVWQQRDGSGVNAGPVTMLFDGVDTYTFTVEAPTVSYFPSDGSTIYIYFLAPRFPDLNDFHNDPNGTSIILSSQTFQLVAAVPEAGSVLLGGMGLLAMLRRRR